MNQTLRSSLRRAGRSAPALAGLGVVVLLLLGGFRSLTELGWFEVGLLGVLVAAIAISTVRRIRRESREQAHGPWEEVELGALLVVAVYAMILPVGGVQSPLYPLLYLLVAFLAAHVPGLGAAGLTAFAIVIDAALFASSGAFNAQRTVLIIAHRLSTIKRSNQIIVLDDGVILERGTHEQLLEAKGRYSEMWNAQLTAAREESEALEGSG